MKPLGFVMLATALSASPACLGESRSAGADSFAADAEPSGGKSAQPVDHSQPADARDAFLAAFDRYQVVGGMSAGHGNKDVDDFILDLIRDPRLADTVNDIAVECGNSLYQDVLDRYIAGGDVPVAEVRAVWRNTTQPDCGFSTFYEALFPLVRRVNQALPAEKRLRVLACDPPIDWRQVASLDDLEPFMDRDATFATVMEREVLAKQRKALLAFGVRHLLHGVPSGVGRYEANGYPGVTYVIAAHVGFANDRPLAGDNAELEAKMASWSVPSLISFAGSWLGELEPAYFNSEAFFAGQTGYPGVDAYLYVGPRDMLLREPRSAQAVLDLEYIAELRQRADALDESAGAPTHPETTFRHRAVWLRDGLSQLRRRRSARRKHRAGRARHHLHQPRRARRRFGGLPRQLFFNHAQHVLELPVSPRGGRPVGAVSRLLHRRVRAGGKRRAIPPDRLRRRRSAPALL
jgi:hypothetical protein